MATTVPGDGDPIDADNIDSGSTDSADSDSTEEIDPVDPLAKTLVLEPLDASATAIIEPLAAPKKKKKRRKWLGWVIALGVIVVLAVVAFVVGDPLIRQFAAGVVRERIIEVLKLDPSTDVDVDLGTGSILLQAIGGSVDDVTVSVPELTFGDITGAAVLTAQRVPLDGTKPVDKLGIQVTITEENAQKLKSFLSGLDLKTIALGEGLITVGTEFDILGFLTLPVSVGLAPSATDGGIAFEPKTIVLNGDEISVDDLRNNPLVSAFAGDLLNSRDFCVASYLPKALSISDVDVVGSDLVIQINGDGTALEDPSLSTMGVCPAS